MRFITDTSVIERLMTAMPRFPGKDGDRKVYYFVCLGKIGDSNYSTYAIEIQKEVLATLNEVKETLTEVEKELEEMYEDLY